MASNLTIESLDFDRIRRGDTRETGDAIEFLWQVMNDIDRRARQGIRLAVDRSEWRVQPLSPTASVDDYDLGNASILRFDGSTSVNLTGLLAPSGGAARLVLVKVLGSGTITIKHNVTSEEPNRILTFSAGDLAVATNKSAWLLYLDSRWREIKLA